MAGSFDQEAGPCGVILRDVFLKRGPEGCEPAFTAVVGLGPDEIAIAYVRSAKQIDRLDDPSAGSTFGDVYFRGGQGERTFPVRKLGDPVPGPDGRAVRPVAGRSGIRLTYEELAARHDAYLASSARGPSRGEQAESRLCPDASMDPGGCPYGELDI